MQKDMVKKEPAEWVKGVNNTVLVILGTIIIACSIGLFIIPFDLVTGGIPGISIIVHELLSHISFLENVPVSTYASVINWGLFLVGLVILGKKFALKTLVSAIVYPFALSFFEWLGGSDVLGGFFNLLSDKYAAYGDVTRIIATVFAGAFIGAGCALTLRGGGSSGGLDIIALVVCKYVKRLKSSQVLFACDATIVILGMFILNDLATSLLGIVSALICSVTLGKIYLGSERALIAHIVSDKYKEINSAIITKLNRTSTVVDCIGGYSGERKKLLITSFTMRQYSEFTALVNSIDKEAFITVHRAQDINGEGWSYNLDKKVKTKDVAHKELD